MTRLIAFATICLTSLSVTAQTQPWYDDSKPFEERAKALVQAMTLEEKIAQMVSDAPAIERLGVPEYNWWNEALHGIARNGKATVYPQTIGLAATFDEELAQRVATAISTEARAKFEVSKSINNRGKYAGLTFWTPNVNIFRDPRWGRGQETYGEDPLLTSRMGVSFVKGLQGDDPKYLKSAACAKHYAVHSGPEELRHSFDAVPTKKDLYETYLPAFEALVREGNVEGVMGAYNAVLGDPACASEFLMKDLLREQWGFDGYVVSDCGALGDIMKGHKKVKTLPEAAALALKTGIDLNCGYAYGALGQAVEQGLVDETMIDERLTQLMLTRFRLGFFDQKTPYDNYGVDKIHSEENIALAREVAQKSIVLLKNNEGVLPLKKDIKNLYVTGPFAASADVLMASYYGITSDLVTVLEGVADKVSLGTSLNYRMGALPFQKNLNPKNWAPNVAKEVEAVICVLGISADREGEEVDAIASDAKGDRVDLKLPQNQIDYFNQLVERKKGPLILVIASGSPVSLEGLEDKADAILQMWYPGEQGGNAVADVLFGDVSPSGHLPLTFPRRIEDLPPYEDYNMKGRTYKYMDKEPLFPFGFGLTYGKVEIGQASISKSKIKNGQSVEVSAIVTNSGNWDVEDVVQVYLAPVNNSELPYYKLTDFKRIVLEKGQSQQVSFTMDVNDFSYINIEGHKSWVKGDYKIYISDALPSKRSLDLGATLPATLDIKLN